MTERPIHRKATDDYRWDEVDLLPYKEDDRALFKAITRQTLFSDPALKGELRYFEMAADGFSTLERHEHMHAVLILRGRGHCLVGDAVPKAFVDCDAQQCGFCTPGFVVAVRAFLNMKPQATEEEIRAGLNGNLCRCGTYANIIQAAVQVVKGGANG